MASARDRQADMRRTLWATAGVEGRALFEQIKMVQRFVDADPQFAESLAQFRALHPDRSDEDLSALLGDILECNQLVRERQLNEATGLYRKIAAREKKRYERMEVLTSARGELKHQLLLMSIVHQNLAICLERSASEGDENRREIEQNYRRAVELSPNLAMAWELLAEFYLGSKRWEDARATYRAAHLADTVEGNTRVLNSRLAHVYVQQALDVASPPARDEPTAPSPVPLAIGDLLSNAVRKGIAHLLQSLGGSGAVAVDPRRTGRLGPPAEGAAAPEADEELRDDAQQRLLNSNALLEEALTTLDWYRLSGWRGKVYLERARLFDKLGREADAEQTWARAAELAESDDNDIWVSLSARLELGDKNARSGRISDAKREYRAGNTRLEEIAASSEGREQIATQCRQQEYDLLARVAILELVYPGSTLSLDALIARWKAEGHFGDHSWGPYYDALQRAGPLLEHYEFIDAASLYYHELLAGTADPVDRRDLTSALLYLYKAERERDDAAPLPSDVIAGPNSTNQSLPVVTPIVLEINQAYADRRGVGDELVTELGERMRKTLDAQFGVRFPGLHVRASTELTERDYVLMVHEVVLERGSCDTEDVLEVALERMRRLLTANIVEFVAHQEAQNLLERNELVEQTATGIAEKENCAHMDPLTGVLRALVAERVPLRRFKDVYMAFRDGWLQGEPVHVAAERIRLEAAVRAELWGNSAHFEHLLLPRPFEAWIRTMAEDVCGVPTLTLEGKLIDQVVAAIKQQVAAYAQPALIVRSQRLRALVRALIAPRLPDVPVLSLRELAVGDPNELVILSVEVPGSP